MFLATQCWNSWVLCSDEVFSFERRMIHICGRQSCRAVCSLAFSTVLIQLVVLYPSVPNMILSCYEIPVSTTSPISWRGLFPFRLSQLKNDLWLIPLKPVVARGTSMAFRVCSSEPCLSSLFESSRLWKLSGSRHIPFCYLYVSKWAMTLLSVPFRHPEFLTFIYSIELTLFRSEYLPYFSFPFDFGPKCLFCFFL